MDGYCSGLVCQRVSCRVPCQNLTQIKGNDVNLLTRVQIGSKIINYIYKLTLTGFFSKSMLLIDIIVVQIFKICECTICSSILQETHVSEIGLLLVAQVLVFRNVFKIQASFKLNPQSIVE